MRVLLIEDDRKAADLLAKALREERFLVDTAYTGEEGDELASVHDYDVIVLDWLLPDTDGLAVCGNLRARGVFTPILMLTARDSLADRVAGLNTGADDYLTKPYALAELLARLHALLRRSELVRPVVLRVADLVLDPLSHRVTRGGRPIGLTPKEYGILEILMRHAGQVVSRTQLAEGVWEADHDTAIKIVEVHISNLRQKIGLPPLVHTVWGRGYRVAEEP
jgi:DNA-binding response OmpR family regulator